ncbi:unnamed protein product [Rotaria magnacalcarata]|uniref:Uncharacterized protein n=1 Tax=Rotaria magnacalcarata TaxID=392030 RepID=A0A8S2NLX9_9BILA|nr:unnamed protein product [Rotaria magnacalcarata]CAF4006853.1 unnamed protein product [Rotaria magnacalcarata]
MNTTILVGNSTIKGITATATTTVTATMSTAKITTATVSTTKITTTTVTTSNILDYTWSGWVNGPCSVTCGTGNYSRQLLCINQFGSICSSCAPNNAIPESRPCFYPSYSAK